MGIVKKNFLIVSTMMSITILIILSIFYFSLPVYYNETRKQELEANFIKVLHILEKTPSDRLAHKIEQLDQRYSNLWFSLYSAEGKHLYPEIVEEELDNDVQTFLENSKHNELGAWSHAFKSKDNISYSLLGEYAYPSVYETNRMLVRAYPHIFFVVVLLTSGVGYIYSRTSAKRIQALSKTTQKMIQLDKDAMCSEVGKDEISVLSRDINLLYASLLNSIEELRVENEKTAERERRKTEFFRISSHELKTPIASLTGIIEGMIYKVGDFKDRDKYLQECRQLLAEQTELVQSILDASSLDLSTASQLKKFSLKDLLAENKHSYDLLAEVNHNQFNLDIDELIIEGNYLYLSKALKNIIDNAFKYTKKGGCVSIYTQGHKMVIDNEVEKTLTENQLKQIFDPFYRPDYSRSRQDGGTGLGLYIVKQIFSRYDIGYEFEAVDDNLMRFTIDFSKVIKD